jgi:hypothetical protein
MKTYSEETIQQLKGLKGWEFMNGIEKSLFSQILRKH